jgi:hypothetical protein
MACIYDLKIHNRVYKNCYQIILSQTNQSELLGFQTLSIVRYSRIRGIPDDEQSPKTQ